MNMFWVIVGVAVIVTSGGSILSTRKKGKKDDKAPNGKGAPGKVAPIAPPPRQKGTAKKQSKQQCRALSQNRAWLKQRWERLEKQKRRGGLDPGNNGFFDEVTPMQLQRMQQMGIPIDMVSITKGKASDILGLFDPPDPTSEQILRFFKISTKDMCYTRAKEEVSLLFMDPENIAKWRNRPPTAWQKEFFRYFKLDIPPDLTNQKARDLREKHEAKLETSAPDRLEEWKAFEHIFDEFSEEAFRQEQNLKKVSLSHLKEMLSQLQREGWTMLELQDNTDLIAEKIRQAKPELLLDPETNLPPVACKKYDGEQEQNSVAEEEATA